MSWRCHCVTVLFCYESKNRNLKKRRKNEYWCDERLKTKVEESTCLGSTGLNEKLEHLKIESRLISVKLICECDG